VPKHDAILLGNHGVATCGQHLLTAYQRLETVEHFARILLVAEQLGGPRRLSRAEVEKLMAGRSRTGLSYPRGSERATASESLEPETASK
jgi:L-fuculose-phosphate aldolase